MSRFPIAMTVVTLGALAVSAAVVVGSFVVIDQRAAQVLKEGPRPVPAQQKRAPSADASRRGGVPAARTNAQTVGAAAGSGAATPSRAPEQSVTGDSSDKKLRAHHRTRHGRRSARHHSQEPSSSEPFAQQPPSLAPQDGGGRSVSFFPFR